LSAGILDGGSGEISLGGSRLNRFMKDVENVTGSMGASEVVTPDEEVASIAAGDAAGSVNDVSAGANIEEAIMPTEGSSVWSGDTPSDPWQALVRVGVQFIGALAAANGPEAIAHPWIERNPATGVQNLRIPLPPPEIARQLANALSALADGLQGKMR
jgi:hypothetical protein